MTYVIVSKAVNCKYSIIKSRFWSKSLPIFSRLDLRGLYYLLLGFSHVMYGSCCNVLVYTAVAIFRLNGVELHSPINQVRVGGVDHYANQWEGATARNNNL